MNDIPGSLVKHHEPRPVHADDNWYYAFLTRLEPLFDDNDVQTSWDVVFEVAPKQWVDMRFLGDEPDSAWTPPKDIPELLLHLEITDNDLRRLLEVSKPIEEGQWYLLELAAGDGDGSGAGDLWDMLDKT